MSLYGSQNLQLDDKNRIRIPAKFKNELGSAYFLLHGIGDCLYVMGKEAFENYIAPLKKVPTSDIAGREAVKAILGTVEMPEEDSQGRFVLPANLKRISGIDKKVIFVGSGEWLEIWPEEKYEQKDIAKAGSIDRAALALAQYGF